jgi:Tol biopolymer transport system component
MKSNALPWFPLLPVRRRIGVVAAFLLGAITLFSPLARAQGSNGKIAFVNSNDNGYWHVCVMNADGSGFRDLHDATLSPFPFNDGFPAFNRAGTKIVFTSDRDGAWNLYTMNSDGTNQTRLTPTGVNYLINPVFSPDSFRIAFAAEPNPASGNADIFLVNATGGAPTQITTGGGLGPAFTPDGKLLFTRLSSTSFDLWKMNPDGTGQALILTADDANSPAISPDGSKIAFGGLDFVGGYSGYDITLANADGTGRTVLIGGANNNQEPSFSPDGSRIVFTSDRSRPSRTSAPGDQELWIMNADGTNPFQLTFSPTGGANGLSTSFHPSWAPGSVGLPGLVSVSFAPPSVIGGFTTTQGTVILSERAPVGGIVVTLSSASPSLVGVPASVTVPAGTFGVNFPVTTNAVAVSTPVTVFASYDGATPSGVLTLVPADTVAITKDEYVLSQKQLKLETTSSSLTATLTAYVTSTGALIGTLTNVGGGKYQLQTIWPTNPQNITVKSSLGGLATGAVTPHN